MTFSPKDCKENWKECKFCKTSSIIGVVGQPIHVCHKCNIFKRLLGDNMCELAESEIIENYIKSNKKRIQYEISQSISSSKSNKTDELLNEILSRLSKIEKHLGIVEKQN